MKPTSSYLDNISWKMGEFEKSSKEYDELLLKTYELLRNSISSKAENDIKKIIWEFIDDKPEAKAKKILKEEIDNITFEYAQRMLNKWFEYINNIE